jgi:hypothetical protein
VLTNIPQGKNKLNIGISLTPNIPYFLFFNNSFAKFAIMDNLIPFLYWVFSSFISECVFYYITLYEIKVILDDKLDWLYLIGFIMIATYLLIYGSLRGSMGL